MSLSTSTALPLTHAPNGIGYKLIELPPELQAVFEGEAPPVLTLVSTPTSTAALLQTPDKTYSFRQKNTSNTLMLLCPTSYRDPNTCANQDDVDMPDANTETKKPQDTGAGASAGEEAGAGAGNDAGKNTEEGMDVVAQLHETVELVPETKERPPVISQMKNTGSKGKWHEKFGRNR